MKKPVVAIVGRPNVGKSSVFNRLVGTKISIIEDTPGVTRDRIYGNVKYNDYTFHLIDTGGIELGDDTFQKDINMQVELAIDEADTISNGLSVVICQILLFLLLMVKMV